MYNDFKDKMEYKKYQPYILPSTLEGIKKYQRYEIDSMAIIEGIIYRFGDPVYGLWNVLKNVMDVSGIVRIHSGKARVIISDLDCEEFEEYKKKQACELLLQKLKAKSCISKTPYYSGTHVEIELPLKI